LIGQPVSADIFDRLTGVSAKTLLAVGRGPSTVTSLTAVSSSTPLVASGKPEVLYVGGEFCPFCAAERWPLIIALSKFGNFSGVEYMLSASTPEVFPDTSTFTFAKATYSSAYLTFVPVESQNRTRATVQPLTSNQTSLVQEYDSTSAIPFIDFGNKYVLVGSQVTPTVLRTGGVSTGSPYSWAFIASELDASNSTIAQNIDGAANRLISAICNLTSDQPQGICSQGFAKSLSLFRLNGSPMNGLTYAVRPSRVLFSEAV